MSLQSTWISAISYKGKKKSAVIIMSSVTCSRKKDAVDGKREGGSGKNRSGSSILRPRR
jgi:hypothetical protein